MGTFVRLQTSALSSYLNIILRRTFLVFGYNLFFYNPR